jgi:hypothetical protein
MRRRLHHGTKIIVSGCFIVKPSCGQGLSYKPAVRIYGCCRVPGLYVCVCACGIIPESSPSGIIIVSRCDRLFVCVCVAVLCFLYECVWVGVAVLYFCICVYVCLYCGVLYFLFVCICACYYRRVEPLRDRNSRVLSVCSVCAYCVLSVCLACA